MDTVDRVLALIGTVLGIIAVLQGIFRTDKENPATLRMALFSILGGASLVIGMVLLAQFTDSLVESGRFFPTRLYLTENTDELMNTVATLTLVFGTIYGIVWGMVLAPWLIRRAVEEEVESAKRKNPNDITS